MRLDSRTRRPISSTDCDSSSVAAATACILVDASSDVPATWPDRPSVISAVRVSVPAADSSCTAEAETFDTMAPTAASKLSAKRMSSARRASLEALFCASCAAASRSALAMACSLNSSTAPAISPSSSLRPSPGSTTSKLPPASSRIALHIAVIGRAIPLPSISASNPPSMKPPAASIATSRSVSRTVMSDSFSSRCWSESRSAFMAFEPWVIAAAESAISATSSSIDFELSISLLSDCRYSSSSPAISLIAATILSSVDDIACSEFSTNLRRASALVATRLVGVDDKRVGERHHRRVLRGDLLRAEFDRRKPCLGRVAGEIVEFVAQHGAAARQLILRQPARSRA